MTNTPLISVIIPAYNVEPYLVQCLDSVDTQSYANFECVIIVDGATDKTFEIAQRYCETHARFKVFYQYNAGSGPARNNGVEHASGEFLCFIDPDDWVETNYVESLVAEQQKGDFDLVVSQTIDVNIDKDDKVVFTKKNLRETALYTTKTECRENFPKVMFEKHLLDGPICKLFRTSIIKDNGVEFPAYRRSQDMVFNFRYFNYIRSLSVISEYTYNIRCEYPPRPNRGRVFAGYNEIVAKVYAEISEQMRSWCIKSEYETSLHSWSFWYLYACIKKNVESNESFEYIYSEPYKTIIKKARPSLKTQKVVRFLLDNHMSSLATHFIQVINKQR